MFGVETIQRFVDDSLAALAGARINSFIPLFTERFARQRLQALAKVEGMVEGGVPSVLFLCTHNAGRSQMAAGWMRRLAADRVEVFSGGSEPASEVNPAAIRQWRRWGSTSPGSSPSPGPTRSSAPPTWSSPWAAAMPAQSSPGKRYEDWEVPDPAESDLEAVRLIRDGWSFGCDASSPKLTFPRGDHRRLTQRKIPTQPNAAHASAQAGGKAW